MPAKNTAKDKKSARTVKVPREAYEHELYRLQGELVKFDRSWYNRGGVDHVMGFCTRQEYIRFLHQCPIFERLLVEDGILLRKYWFSVSDEDQQRRCRGRLEDPLRRWKLSPMDLESIPRWEDYSRAKDEMFIHTDIP